MKRRFYVVVEGSLDEFHSAATAEEARETAMEFADDDDGYVVLELVGRAGRPRSAVRIDAATDEAEGS